MLNWLANLQNYLNNHPNFVIPLIVGAALLALILWIWGPVLLTSWRKYESYRERASDTDRYRRNIGQLLTIPVLVVAALYTLHQIARSAHETAARNSQDRYGAAFQAMASVNVTTRLGGVYALAHLMGGDRQEELCPDGNQRPLASRATDAAPVDATLSPEEQLYRMALQGIAAHAVASSHMPPLASSGDPGQRAWAESVDEAAIGADTRAALTVIARRPCESGSRQIPLDLSHGYFRGASMAYAQLIRSDLRGSDFSSSELYLATFYHASADKARFGGSNLTHASFATASLAGADFGPDENLASPNLPRLPHLRTQLVGAQIVTADARGARFWCAMMSDARLDNSQFDGADFSRAALSRTTFLSARGVGAKFNAACAPKANFSNPVVNGGGTTDFSGADFSEGYFRGARFDGISLRGAIFVRADLAEANFENADLTDADFRGANLTGARFGGANLAGAKLGGALVCDTRGLPESIAAPNCAAQFVPVGAGRFGDACVPPDDTGLGLNQQCPFDSGDAAMTAATTER